MALQMPRGESGKRRSSAVLVRIKGPLWHNIPLRFRHPPATWHPVQQRVSSWQVLPSPHRRISHPTIPTQPASWHTSLAASGKATLPWHQASILAMVDVPLASAAVSALMGRGGWDHNWALAASESPTAGQVAPNAALPAQHVERTGGIQVAVLQVVGMAVPGDEVQTVLFASAVGVGQGCQVAAVGSPFGLLSPTHFFNSMASGMVSNTWPPGGTTPSILVTDMHCLPGMEGGPVVVGGGEEQRVVGMLLPPLRHVSNGTQVQLAVTWDAISATLQILPTPPPHPAPTPLLTAHPTHALQPPPSHPITDPSLSPHCAYTKGCPNPAVLDAACSVVLIRIGMGSWASGVVLSPDGLILTNAHLIDSGRFRTTPSRFNSPTHSADGRFPEPAPFNSSVLGRVGGVGRVALTSAGEGIRVRVGQAGAARWHSAKVVYVSRGVLDVALLQVEGEGEVTGLTAICPEMMGANEGETAVVVGHGLFGPDTHLPPSMTAGIVSKVVHIDPCPSHTSLSGGRQVAYPVQIQTSAAVHAGNSGGAVINQQGKMIGLVTSNARHNGSAVLPHLNFSISCGVLQPLFAFAASDNRDLSQLSSLDMPHPGLSKIWALVPTPSTRRIEEVKPEANEKDRRMQERGAKFRTFISEGRPLPLGLKVVSHVDGPAVGTIDSFEVGSHKSVEMLGSRMNGRVSGDRGTLGREFLYARM